MALQAPTEQLLVDKTHPNFWILTLNRPEQRNALRTSLLEDIAVALEDASSEPAVRAVIITGGDQIFAAGADINEMAEMNAIDTSLDKRPSLWARILAFPLPIIAAVNGYCLGAGNELLLRCDLAVAGPCAKFGQPEINFGIMPGAGGTTLLPKRIGTVHTARLAMLGEFLDASEAFKLGLVSHISETNPLEDAKTLAKKLTCKPPLALRSIKDLLHRSIDMNSHDALSYERKLFSLLFASNDKQEGVSAFLEKRKPEFTGY